MSDVKAIVDAVRNRGKKGEHDPMDPACACSSCGDMGVSEGLPDQNDGDDFLSQDSEQPSLPEESYDMQSGDGDQDSSRRRLGSIMRGIRMKHMGRKD